MFREDEMKVLNEVSKMLFGCKFEWLSEEEQDCVYCYAEDNGLFFK